MQTVGIIVATGRQDDVPEADDVTAGPWGLLVFVLLVVATAILLRSFVKQLRKTEKARKDGVFGPVDPDEEPRADASGDETTRREP